MITRPATRHEVKHGVVVERACNPATNSSHCQCLYFTKQEIRCVLHRAEAPLSPHPKLLASKRRVDAAAAAAAAAAADDDDADDADTVLAFNPPDA